MMMNFEHASMDLYYSSKYRMRSATILLLFVACADFWSYSTDFTAKYRLKSLNDHVKIYF